EYNIVEAANNLVTSWFISLRCMQMQGRSCTTALVLSQTGTLWPRYVWLRSRKMLVERFMQKDTD
ncbi:MAG: hypothetical protein M3Y27_12440, partial [Acidobacteriota bacterium]|nr:hypothetical protein [Acidobacteriota bacterium]